MKSKNSIGKWTLAALLGYELTLLAISVTPAAGKGTSFGKPGMWQNMILIAAFYRSYAVYIGCSDNFLDRSPSLFHTDIRGLFLLLQTSGRFLSFPAVSGCHEHCPGKPAAPDPLVRELSWKKKKTGIHMNLIEF